eukprot:scaffold1243_cov403-Prasinococcus_capsulatus_cf.AAC.19
MADQHVLYSGVCFRDPVIGAEQTSEYTCLLASTTGQLAMLDTRSKSSPGSSWRTLAPCEGDVAMATMCTLAAQRQPNRVLFLSCAGTLFEKDEGSVITQVVWHPTDPWLLVSADDAAGLQVGMSVTERRVPYGLMAFPYGLAVVDVSTYRFGVSTRKRRRAMAGATEAW